MSIYSPANTLRVAKRYNNAKRAYLLVNPLQAKHIPVSPTQALHMMTALGQLLYSKYPETKLIIGFAETATAIGAAVASCFPASCTYLHTTRESIPHVQDWVEFSEEHSHAVEQKLFADGLHQWISQSDTILFVEDEISTGKTLINMIQQLKQLYPALSGKKLVAASILNRVSPDNLSKMQEAGIICESLVTLPQTDYTELMAAMEVHPAQPVEAVQRPMTCEDLGTLGQLDPRTGVQMGDYTSFCGEMAQRFLSAHPSILHASRSLLLLGTEECMYPALVLGQALEKAFPHLTVRCHATTRSPIGIASADQYPITSGCKIESFYSPTRDTYIYNLNHYDTVVVVTDAMAGNIEALHCLATALEPHQISHILCMQGGQYVWHI